MADTKKTVFPGRAGDTFGSLEKPWGGGYFKELYDDAGDAYVHTAQMNSRFAKQGLSVVDGKLCVTYTKEAK